MPRKSNWYSPEEKRLLPSNKSKRVKERMLSDNRKWHNGWLRREYPPPYPWNPLPPQHFRGITASRDSYEFNMRDRDEETEEG